MPERISDQYHKFLRSNIRILITYAGIALKRVLYKCKALFLWQKYYDALPGKKTDQPLRISDEVADKIAANLKAQGITVKPFSIDTDKYRKYVSDAEYNAIRLYQKRGKSATFAEKSLEHFVAAELISLSADDVYIDIANSCSPVPEIYHGLYGCTVYRQDLLYPEGQHGKIIGGDAANMPLPDGFATKMAMHCSFEHFEDNADSRFIKEAERVLKSGGKLCVIPFYQFTEYAIKTNPVMFKAGTRPFEDDATLYCTRQWVERHGRFYDAAHIASRLLSNVTDLTLTVYRVRNASEVDSSCYLRFAAVFEKK